MPVAFGVYQKAYFMQECYHNVMVLLFIVYGLILRVRDLGGPSYWMDESFSIATAQALLQGDWLVRSPLYHLLLGIIGELSDWNIYVLRGLSLTIGVAMLVVGYSICQRWFTKPIAITFAALLSFSTIEIAWSRQIRMYVLLQVLFWLSLFFYQQWRTKKIHWIIPLISTVVTVLTHEFGLYLFCVYLWYELVQRFRRPVIPFILTLMSVFILTHVIMPTVPYVNYWWHYLYFIGVQQSGFILLAVCGVYVLSKKYQLLTQWLVMAWFGWLSCLSFIVPLLQYRYLFMTFPIILLFAATGGVWLWQQRWFGKILLGASISLILAQGQLTVIPQSFYKLESDPTTAPFSYKTFTPQPNFTAAYTFLADYPTTPVATPYPVVHQLYTGEWPDYVVFVNLTGGTYPTIPATYSEPSQLLTGVEIFLILDQFSEYRLDDRWESIMAQSEVIWEDENLPWSSLRIYRIVPL
ncbi:MAG: hypothetical protein ACD_41C00179G0009 [uncultured bacterium]|nr:MAG: hypothetical protein ACD_41C00179G0009 [uncultured bacterium]HBY73280.1 hypothetical protein [Candidatus Kerfeldbacteria bacterium]